MYRTGSVELVMVGTYENSRGEEEEAPEGRPPLLTAMREAGEGNMVDCLCMVLILNCSVQRKPVGRDPEPKKGPRFALYSLSLIS